MTAITIPDDDGLPEAIRKRLESLMGGNVKDINEWTGQQLDEVWSFGLLAFSRVISLLAAVWNEKKRRGDPLPKVTGGLERIVVRVAEGRLDAQAAINLQDRRSILNHFDGMPFETQRELADGKLIDFVDPSDRQVKKLTIREIPNHHLGRVLVDGEIKSAAAQRLHLRPVTKEAAAKPQKATIEFDAKDQKFKFGSRFAPRLDIDAAVAKEVGPFVPPTDDPTDLESLTFLPKGGRVRLEEHCKKVGMSPAKWVLLVLHNAGFKSR